jgi:hypothetical protein
MINQIFKRNVDMFPYKVLINSEYYVNSSNIYPWLYTLLQTFQNLHLIHITHLCGVASVSGYALRNICHTTDMFYLS